MGITLAVNLKHMDAIQPHELRIGNWVIGEDGNYYQIEQIVPRLWHIEPPIPIPLTPEILEKAGFKEDRTGFALPDIMSLSFSVTKDFGYMACWGDKSLHLPYDVKYLHQLQNLYFALTGEELQIEL